MNRVAIVLKDGIEVNRIVLDSNEDPSNWGAVWDETIEPYDTSFFIERVTMRQFRLQLLEDNYLDLVETQLASLSSASKISWEYATELDRSEEMVDELQGLLGLTEEQMNAVFYKASLKPA